LMPHRPYLSPYVNDETDEPEVVDVLYDYDDKDQALFPEYTGSDADNVEDDEHAEPSPTATNPGNEDSQSRTPTTTNLQTQIQRWVGTVGPGPSRLVFVDEEAEASEDLESANNHAESNPSRADTDFSLGADNKPGSEHNAASPGAVPSVTVDPTLENDVPINNNLSSLDTLSTMDLEVPWPRPPASPPLAPSPGPQPTPQPHTAASQSRASSSSGSTIQFSEVDSGGTEHRLYLQPSGNINIEALSLLIGDENDIELADLSSPQDSATGTLSSGPSSGMNLSPISLPSPSQEALKSDMSSPITPRSKFRRRASSWPPTSGPQEAAGIISSATSPRTSIDPKHSWASRKGPYYETLSVSLDRFGDAEDPEVAQAAPQGLEGRSGRRERLGRFRIRVLNGVCKWLCCITVRCECCEN
jgi:hypothetical protein